MSARKFDINKAKKYGNVRVSFEDNIINVSLHWTKIVRFSRLAVKLNSGGWQTTTTKTAMNTALGQHEIFSQISVFQKKGQWYVSYQNETVKFFDGMMLVVDELGKIRLHTDDAINIEAA